MVGLCAENGTIDYIPAAMDRLATETGRKVWTGLTDGFPDLTNEVTVVYIGDGGSGDFRHAGQRCFRHRG
jgi:hypothetical protein